jgi:hypothetical protein
MSYSLLGARKRRVAAALLTLCVATLAACSGSSPVGPSTPASSAGLAPTSHRDRGSGYTYTYMTIDNPNDPSYTILTGINNEDKISGYYGTGTKADPNHGFILYEPYGSGNFFTEDFPNAVQTQVWALNNKKSIAGFYIDQHGWIFGFSQTNDIWTSYKDPKLRHGTSNVTELLGLDDAGLAVGFYTDSKAVNHGFELDQATGRYHSVIPPGVLSVIATGINGKGDICGYATVASGATVIWMLKGGTYTIYAHPSSLVTKAYAINWQDQIVGSYVDLSGATHGFILTNPLTSQQWTTIDEPNAAGTTVVTSIEDHRNMVGYYVDGSGNTNGFLGTFTSR